jgi:hypothetical protein
MRCQRLHFADLQQAEFERVPHAMHGEVGSVF